MSDGNDPAQRLRDLGLPVDFDPMLDAFATMVEQIEATQPAPKDRQPEGEPQR